MKRRYWLCLFCFFLLQSELKLSAQDNNFSHYFSSSSLINPALTGDTRFIQLEMVDRIQTLTNGKSVSNKLYSIGGKLRNFRSGIGLNINQNNADIQNTRIKANYSYSFGLYKSIWMKLGAGVSWNFANTKVYDYHYPDQFDRYGYTGSATQESNLQEKSNFPAFALGGAVYNEFGWLALSADYLNRPKINFAGQDYPVPLSFSILSGYLFPLNKKKLTHRIFSTNGGLEPISSLGPVVNFMKNGPFYQLDMGVNGFLKPVFWGANYRISTIQSATKTNRSKSISLMGGYRHEAVSIAYSYTLNLGAIQKNTLGIHEISIVFYLFSTKEDYVKTPLLPLPNQLMY